MKSSFLLFLFTFFIFSSIFSQEKKIEAILVSKKHIEATSFVNIDPFGYQYYIKDNVFIKQKDKEIFQYKNLSLGKITKIDLENPLKIVLFYEGFNTVVILDNQLNETQIISFSKNNSTIIASAIGLASQNRLWVFNSLNMQLNFFDFLRLIYTPLAQPFQNAIKDYDSTFNTFYWIEDDLDFYSCDIFGKISWLGKVPNYEKIEIISNKFVCYQIANQLYYYDVKDNISTLIKIDEKTFESFQVKDQFLIIFTNNEISTYQISLP